MQRALILKLGAIGDVIMAIPAARALHDAGHEIIWVAGLAAAPILRMYSWITVIEADEAPLLRGSLTDRLRAIPALWGKLPKGEYAVCATLYYDKRYRALALPVRAGRKLMLSQTERARMLLPGRHHTDEYARILLGAPDDVRPQQLAPVQPDAMPANPLPHTGRPRVVLAPAGGEECDA